VAHAATSEPVSVTAATLPITTSGVAMSTRISSILSCPIHRPDAGLDSLVAARRVNVVLDAGQAQRLARRREDGAAPWHQIPDAGAGRLGVVQDLDGGHREALVRRKRASGRGTRCHQRASGVVDPTRVAATGVVLRMLGIRSAPSYMNSEATRS
jgi:hypothetical protein